MGTKFCQHCGKPNEEHTAALNEYDNTPKENDITVCLYCGTISKFDKRLNLVALNDRELDELLQTDPTAFLLAIRIRYKIIQTIHSN